MKVVVIGEPKLGNLPSWLREKVYIPRGGKRLGSKHSPETIQKMRETHLKKCQDPDYVAGLVKRLKEGRKNVQGQKI